MKLHSILLTLGLSFFSATTFAHFQMLYTPESAVQKEGAIPLRMVFTHPFADEHTMDMTEPEQFFVVHKGKKADLKSTLKAISWTGNANSGNAYETDYQMRGMGDYVFSLTPAPYLEKGEGDGIYIQQITKLIVNKAGVPTDWDKPVGLKTEILPLTKPYAVWAGSTFSGIVLSDGKPVANTEVEIEYLNADIDLANHKVGRLKYSAPQASFETLVVITDELGKFTFGLPKAGWWGFAAVGSGPDKEFNGRKLYQDAVIWVQAKEMK